MSNGSYYLSTFNSPKQYLLAGPFDSRPLAETAVRPAKELASITYSLSPFFGVTPIHAYHENTKEYEVAFPFLSELFEYNYLPLSKAEVLDCTHCQVHGWRNSEDHEGSLVAEIMPPDDPDMIEYYSVYLHRGIYDQFALLDFRTFEAAEAFQEWICTAFPHIKPVPYNQKELP